MQKIKYFLIVIVFFVLGYILINHLPKVLMLENIKSVLIAGQSIKVDLALTKETQIQGLSGRAELKENEGMLFIFDHSGIYPFWMKDMNFPIDMIWVNENMKVVYIKKNARPELFPEMYTPNENAKYVLEVVSGFSDKNNLKVGDEVELKESL